MKNHLQRVLVLSIGLILPLTMFAKSISGTVRDASGEAIIGASVLVPNTTTGTVTDLDGLFHLEVEAGKKMFVNLLHDVENGDAVEFDRVLLVDNEGAITVGTPVVEGAKVVAEVKSKMVKGDKVLVFHKKRRKGLRKLNGHREQFTEIVIKEVIA